MRLMKSLPYAISALALAAGTAFAGQSSTNWLSEQYSGPQSDESFSAGLSNSESTSMSASESMDVVYIIPVEVTEYWVLAPSESSSEMPG